jgi:hypothetical protein
MTSFVLAFLYVLFLTMFLRLLNRITNIHATRYIKYTLYTVLIDLANAVICLDVRIRNKSLYCFNVSLLLINLLIFVISSAILCYSFFPNLC